MTLNFKIDHETLAFLYENFGHNKYRILSDPEAIEILEEMGNSDI